MVHHGWEGMVVGGKSWPHQEWTGSEAKLLNVKSGFYRATSSIEAPHPEDSITFPNSIARAKTMSLWGTFHILTIPDTSASCPVFLDSVVSDNGHSESHQAS